uniref:Odorant receptor n=1 Tax=Megaselia scalaris TaxID=36166 RepID=T1H478_MEGSC
LSKRAHEVFSIQILVNFLSSIFILCFVSFQVTVNVPPVELFKYILFLLFEIIQIGTICFLGEQLQIYSKNIGAKIFEQEWWEEDLSYQKKILFMIARSQKPAVLVARGFGSVSLQSFSDIMAKSYQFFVCLRYVYNK